tara:strand:- start:49 stop:639 length:591 start_codon:yes stop_codon:yes gene_type:complete
MTGFMDNYVDVATRLKIAFERWPELRIQETHREIVEMPDKTCFIRCVVTIWRTADDPIPVIASACEVYPGRTPYTKTSESEVGYTSAIGRALAMAGIGANKSIASRDEVEAAQSRQPTRLAEVVPFPEEGPQKVYPSNKQLSMMRGLANGKGIKGDDLKAYCCEVLGRTILSTNDLTKQDISKVIDALQVTGELEN